MRFLYVHPLPWYLRVRPQRDVIEQPITGDLGALRKAFCSARATHADRVAGLADRLSRRPGVSRGIACTRERSISHSGRFITTLHMARGNYRDFLTREQVRLKKYLYVLRPLLATLWIEQDRGPVPMRFETLVETLISDPLRAAIELLVLKGCATADPQRLHRS